MVSASALDTVFATNHVSRRTTYSREAQVAFEDSAFCNDRLYIGELSFESKRGPLIRDDSDSNAGPLNYMSMNRAWHG